jgi:hypothetical protein
MKDSFELIFFLSINIFAKTDNQIESELFVGNCLIPNIGASLHVRLVNGQALDGQASDPVRM